MSKVDGEKRLDVSIYLLKPTQASIAESELFSQIDSPRLLRNDIPGGKFMPLPMDASPPKWASHVETLLADGTSLDLLAQNAGGALWVPRGKREVRRFLYLLSVLRIQN